MLEAKLTDREQRTLVHLRRAEERKDFSNPVLLVGPAAV
jgi:hypothetical protein